MWKSALNSLGTLLIITACNSYTSKDQANYTANGVPPNFSVIQSNILQPKCVMCHSASGGNAGGINVETYANVMASITQIQNAIVVAQSMPPGQSLTSSLRQLFATWVADGEPETSSSPEMPTEIAQNQTSVQPTFSSISENIFTPKCASCHSPSGPMPVTNYNYLISSGWVVPDNLNNSTLYQAVKNGTMPPSGALAQSDVDTIGQWITDGAQNN